MITGEGSNQDVWVYDQQRDATTRLTFGGGANVDPGWSPDGRYVFLGSFSSGMFWTRADGAGQPQPLTQTKAFQVPWSFTPDGKRLAYFELVGAPQIWTVTLEDANGQMKAGKPEQFLKSQLGAICLNSRAEENRRGGTFSGLPQPLRWCRPS